MHLLPGYTLENPGPEFQKFLILRPNLVNCLLKALTYVRKYFGEKMEPRITLRTDELLCKFLYIRIPTKLKLSIALEKLYQLNKSIGSSRDYLFDLYH